MSKTTQQPTQPTIEELFAAVKKHSDFVFGTIFTVGDFAKSERDALDKFPTYDATDAIVCAGNIFIEETGYRPDFYDALGVDQDDWVDEDEENDEEEDSDQDEKVFG